MGESQKSGIGPCDKCGSNDDCRCGPCQCKWCRYDRGEATALEQAQIKRALDDRYGFLKPGARNG